MEEVSELLRDELRTALAANASRLREGLQAELTRPHPEQPRRPLQFEADPWFWGITSTATEKPVFDGESIDSELPKDWFARCESAGISWDGLLSDEVCPWFAEHWQSVGGPAQFSPAFLFLHGYHDEQYHLESCCWLPAAVAFGIVG